MNVPKKHLIYIIIRTSLEEVLILGHLWLKYQRNKNWRYFLHHFITETFIP